MLRLAALAVLALLVAGCATSDDAPDPDPTGLPTGTPSSTSSPSSSTSSSSIAPTPGVTLGGGQQDDLATHADFPGLIVSGQLDVSGNVAYLEARADNTGPRTYRVSAICVDPWSEGMFGPSGDDVAHRQPMATCLAFGLRDFPPGDSIPFSLTWNGTLWNDASGGYAAAPDGTYTWTARFQVYSGGEQADFEDSATLELEFQVLVS